MTVIGYEPLPGLDFAVLLIATPAHLAGPHLAEFIVRVVANRLKERGRFAIPELILWVSASNVPPGYNASPRRISASSPSRDAVNSDVPLFVVSRIELEFKIHIGTNRMLQFVDPSSFITHSSSRKNAAR